MDKNIDLDEYIVMPSFSLSAADEETDAMKIHYANKTSGVAVCNREEFRENWKFMVSGIIDPDRPEPMPIWNLPGVIFFLMESIE